MPATSLDRPCCLCLALCNDLIEDAKSHNRSVIGIFNGIGAAQVPTLHPRLSILASVGNADPRTPVKVVVQTPGGQELFSANGETLDGDRTSVTDFPLEVPGVVFPEFGVYSILLYVGDELIARRHFNVFTPSA